MRCASCGLLKSVRAVRADGELKLEQELVGRLHVAVARAAELPADLAELRGPEGERGGNAAVACARRDLREARRLVRGVEAQAGEPALRELVVDRRVEAAQAPVEVVALVEHPFEAADDAPIRPLLQRLPAIRHVDAAERIVPVGDRAARPARPEFDVRVLGDVLEGLEMRVERDVAGLAWLEDAFQLAAVSLTRRLDERGGIREDLRDGDAVAVELL